jgi:hypothetical protein
MPIHRCIANAAGGTSHRLKPALAMVCSFASTPYELVADAELDMKPLLKFLMVDRIAQIEFG